MENMTNQNQAYQFCVLLFDRLDHTVEPPKEDTLRRGQCIKYLSIKDTAFVPKFTSLYKLYIEKPLKEDNLSRRDKTAEFILVPKCPLFGGSTV